MKKKAKCIDHYTKLQVENFQVRDPSELKAVDPRLEDIVNRMFQRCFEDKKFKQAIGISIETRRLDVFEKAILTSVSVLEMKSFLKKHQRDCDLIFFSILFLKTNVSETISYAYKITLSLIQNRKFRNAILKLLVKIYSNLPNPDYVNLVQCLIYLDEPEQVATVLENLIRSNNYLMAYQLGLDLYESATQQFLLKVKNLLKALITITQPMEMESDSTPEIKTEPTTTTPTTTESKPSTVNDEVKTNIEKMLIILNGEITINSNMQFLIKNNHSDLLVLKTIKVIK